MQNFPEEIRAGELRSRGMIRRPMGNRDVHGGSNKTFEDVATVSCGVETLQGRELFDAQRRFSEVTARVTMRYPRSFTVAANMQIVVGSSTYDIRAVDDVNKRHKKLWLWCRELT